MLADHQHSSDFACPADIEGIPYFPLFAISLPSSLVVLVKSLSDFRIVALTLSLYTGSFHCIIPVHLIKEIRKGKENAAGTYWFLK